MFDSILSFYLESAKAWNTTASNAMAKFFVKTGTQYSAALLAATQFEDEPHRMSDLVHSDLTVIEYLKTAYLDGSLKSHRAFREIVLWYVKAVHSMAKRGTAVTQKMTSTGISSTDTGRIAAQMLGDGLKMASLGKAALTSGGAGAVISGGIEAVSSGVKLAKGEIDGGEFAANVAKETAGGGLAAAGGTAAASATAAAAAAVLAGTAAPLWVPGAIAVGAAVAVGSGIKSLWDLLWD